MPGDLQTRPLVIGQSRQLFVDDVVVETMDGITRRLHAVEKHPENPVIRPDELREGQSIEYTTVIWNEVDKQFQAWYAVGDNMDAQSTPGTKSRFTIRSCYATSPDGISWHKPDLGLVAYKGSTANNIVDTERWLQSVVYTPPAVEPDSAKRYKMLSYKSGGYHVSFSSDGIHWNHHPDSPVWRIRGDVAPTIYDEMAGQYVSFAKVHDEYEGHSRRLVGRGVSQDFVYWSAPELILRPDAEDEGWTLGRPGHHTEFYGLCGFPYESLYLGLLWVFRVTGKVPGGTNYGTIHAQLVHSRDGLHWQRAFSRMPLIPTGPQESFDWAYIHAASRPLIVGDEVWIYYDGHDGDHGSYWYHEPWGSNEPKRGGSLGLGRLRLDGFVSLAAGHEIGRLITHPLLIAEEVLVVNAQASRGMLRVEVLDAEGLPVAGLSKDECVPFTGDSVRHVVRWRSSASLGLLRNQPVRLRFWLQDAELYSFHFAPSHASA